MKLTLTSLKEFFLKLVILLLIFQDPLKKVFPFVGYLDETLALMFFPFYIMRTFQLKSAKIKVESIFIFFLGAILTVAGLVANYSYHFQQIKYAYGDLLLCFKFFLVMETSALLWDKTNIDNIKARFTPLIKLLVYVFAALTAANELFKIFPNQEYRYGIMVNKLFYVTPAYLASIGMFLIALLILLENKVLTKETILLLLVIISTLRVKAMISSTISIALCLYINSKKKKISFSELGIAGIASILFGMNQIKYYYANDEYARSVLTRTSIQIAKDYFPIGTGFGTFASFFAGKYYSSVFYKYGIHNTFGLSRRNASFMSDTFWPMIIGQFGVIGLACYVGIILIVLVRIQNSYEKENLNYYLAKLICIIFVIASSLSDSAFVNPISIPLAIIIGIGLVDNRHHSNA